LPAKIAARAALGCRYSAHDQTALFAGLPAPTGGNCCTGEGLKMRRPDGRSVSQARPHHWACYMPRGPHLCWPRLNRCKASPAQGRGMLATPICNRSPT